ncbi:MAG: TraR/DksA family transcriptional regulator [Treponema sp.]|nr:TraR/DksA family transcriptional regulator [Treponema sp.]
MDKEFVEQMKTKLQEQRRTILNSLATQNADYKSLVSSGDTTGDVIDVASDVIDGQLLESLGTQDANRLKMIDNALDRIKQGKYGMCLKCGKEIPRERLEALPYAFMCVDCKTSDERRNR